MTAQKTFSKTFSERKFIEFFFVFIIFFCKSLFKLIYTNGVNVDGFVADQNLHNLKNFTPGSVSPRFSKRYYYD